MRQESSNANKIMCLKNFEVYEFLVANNIKTERELFAQAHSQKAVGKKDLANFLSRSSKALNDIIVNTWKMESAQQELDRAEIPIMDIINNNALQECMPECLGTWIQCAKEVLQMNNVPVAEFGGAVCDLLTSGRRKNRNIVICGPANCDKTKAAAHPFQNILQPCQW